MNKHKIAWIALAVGIVVVLMLTWLVGVSPRLTHIKEADAQTAQIEESNKKTRDQIETLRMASETIGLQKDRLRQLQRQIPDGYNQNEFIDSLNAAADGAGVSIQSVTFDEATTAEVPSEMQGTIKAGRLVQVPVSITANGSYDAMRGFVQAVQGINRIAVPEDVTYTLDKGGDATKNIEPMCLTRPDCIAIDENVDIVEAKKLTDAHGITISGHLPLTLSITWGLPHSREAPYVSSHILMCFHSVLASICRSSPSEIT